ncbi:hypothetical protein EDC01DRAFT_437597 [Geopyxis carbonaria]|nr:hypothetical protein EDC01DRAFT_437597 [Geopyxis carbonaria]
MTGSQRPSTPAFRAVNVMEITSSDVADEQMAAISSLTALSEAAPQYEFDETNRIGSSQPVFGTESTQTVSPEDSIMMRDGSDLGTEKAHSNADSTETTETSAKPGKAKKKKGSKFHCEGFGDCKLTFTRSEHLARHIRKHTGERPFMCHCGRWFSRLDNLRQHSSTVHADEEIPNDSLAATGTRYQRHLRTERVRQPTRSRAQSLSDVQSPEPQAKQAQAPVKLALSTAERPTRPRPDPLILPHETQEDPSFNQYRSQTPPESPASLATTSYHRSGTTYRQRAAPYPPPLSQAASPTLTPTRRGGNLDSPFSTPNNSARNSLNLSAYNAAEHLTSNRRLSMPAPPTPSLFDSRSLALPIPSGSPTASEQSLDSRRDSVSSLASEDRRKTWHVTGFNPQGYQNPIPRDVLSPTTRSFARASLQGGTTDTSIAHGRYQLPSINHILSEPSPALPASPIASALPAAPSTPSTPDQRREHRVSWAGVPNDPTKQQIPMDWNRTRPEGVATRRVAPGQMRSSHGRSVSNIETKRWGVVHQSNPFSGPWFDRDRRESMQHNTPIPLSLENTRNSGCYGGGASISSPREHRQSFGSSNDSNVSEGINTPIASSIEVSQPRILGEPGDIFHSEVNTSNIFQKPRRYTHTNAQSPEKDDHESSCSMNGIESTGRAITPVVVHDDRKHWNTSREPKIRPAVYANVSRLDALVSVATGAAKI